MAEKAFQHQLTRFDMLGALLTVSEIERLFQLLTKLSVLGLYQPRPRVRVNEATEPPEHG